MRKIVKDIEATTSFRMGDVFMFETQLWPAEKLFDYKVFNGFILDGFVTSVRLDNTGDGLNQDRGGVNKPEFSLEKIWTIIPRSEKTWQDELAIFSSRDYADRDLWQKSENVELIYSRYGAFLAEGPWWEYLEIKFLEELQSSFDSYVLNLKNDQLDRQNQAKLNASKKQIRWKQQKKFNNETSIFGF